MFHQWLSSSQGSGLRSLLIGGIAICGGLLSASAIAQSGNGAIGDRIWTDTNSNGIQDVDEPNLGSVTIFINLYTCDGDFVASDTSNFAGDYGFSGLDAGCYVVEFVSPQDLPLTAQDVTVDTLDSDADPTTGFTDQIQLADGEVRTDVDAGFRKRDGRELGDRFWEDLNANGEQDPGEPGIAGVPVSLLDCAGNLLDTRVTDSNGMYLFSDLDAGCYVVDFDPPNNCIVTLRDATNDAEDSDINPVTGRTGQIDLGPGDSDLTNDGGCYFPAALGDFLWHDVNRNGIQEAGEPGIPDKLVVLLDADMQPTGMTTTTDANGEYLFDGLTPGVYFVQFMAPDGFVFTVPNAGGNDDLDSDANGNGKSPAVVLESNETDLSIDAGVYEPASPAITLEKSTNGMDADDPTGPFIAVGDPVVWEYVVTNTGSIALFNLNVTDDQGVDVSCPGTTLAPGDSMTCTASGTAVAGQYENLGEACADSDGGQVCDDDPSHYFGPEPGIDIEKATNGEDADNPPGPSVQPGSVVNWTYLITNTGNVALTNVLVLDDQGVAVACPRDELGVNESMTCTGQGSAIIGQYANLGMVCGDSVVGEVCDDDPSHYTGVTPGINIEKATNGQDADSPRGPRILIGGNVTWTYVVTNTGEVLLSDVLVLDDQGVNVTCPSDAMAPGTSMTCIATGTAIAGQYANVGMVCGNTPAGEEICDDDPSHYFGVAPGVDIRKNVEGPDVITYVRGDTATFDITVTNTGNLPLRNVVVSDPLVSACERTTAVLPPGATVTYTCATTADIGFNNEICVDAVGAGIPVNDCDTSEVEVIDIDIRKQAEGLDSQMVPFGGTVTWQIVVTNTGSSDLENVEVTDEMSPQCDVIIGDLAVGDSFAYSCEATNVVMGFLNVAKATGSRNERMVMDSDPSDVMVVQPACELEVDMTCAIVQPPSSDYQCDKPIDVLTFIWDGNQNVRIIAYKGDTDEDVLADIDNIAPGQEISVSGYDGAPNDVFFEVFDAGTNNKLGESNFHLSCSDDEMDGPEDCGMPQGNGKGNDNDLINQWLLEGIVDAGGVLDCTSNPQPPSQSCEFPASSGALCEKRPTEVSFVYNGGDCSQSDNTQSSDKWECDDNGSVGEPVRVVIFKDDKIYADESNVNIGDVIVATADMAGRDEFDSEVFVEIINASGNVVQEINLHTSCSQDLRLGDRFGALEVFGFVNEDQGSVQGGVEVIYTYTVSSTGGDTANDISVIDALLGPVPGSPIDMLAPGESVTLTQLAIIMGTTTNSVTVSGSTGGAVCEDMDSVTVTELPPPPDIDCSKPIDSLSMIWDGSQAIRVVAYKGDTGDEELADIDNVQVGDEVTVDGFAGSQNDVFWEIFEAGTNNKIGESNFHMSCSDDDMDDEDDCGKRQGDGKGNDSDLINDWLFEGMVDSDETLDCS